MGFRDIKNTHVTRRSSLVARDVLADICSFTGRASWSLLTLKPSSTRVNNHYLDKVSGRGVGNAINKFRSPQRKAYLRGGSVEEPGMEIEVAMAMRCRCRPVQPWAQGCQMSRCPDAQVPRSSVANRVAVVIMGSGRCYWLGGGRSLSGCGERRAVGRGGRAMSRFWAGCCTRAASVTSWGDPAYLSPSTIAKFSLKPG